MRRSPSAPVTAEAGAAPLGKPDPSAIDRMMVGGIEVGVLTRLGWARNIVSHCQANRRNHRRPRLIFAANGQIVALFAMDKTFRSNFAYADDVTADGQPLVWASRLTKHALPERAATTDLFHDIARAAEVAGSSFYLFGATERSSLLARSSVEQQYPKLKIVGRRSGYFSPHEEPLILQRIRDAKPDILWVGLGAKKQADFVARNLASLRGVGCVMTCGGLFDHLSCEMKRAPAWMQNMCLEWLFRTWQEPKKYFMRYVLTNPVAIFLLLTRTRNIAPGSNVQTVADEAEPASENILV